MCLRLIELTKPEVVILTASWTPSARNGDTVQEGFVLDVPLVGLGCTQLSSARTLLIPRSAVEDCASLLPVEGGPWTTESRRELLQSALEVASSTTSTKCRGLRMLSTARERDASDLILRGRIPAVPAQQEFCVAIAAEFDQDWGVQHHPDPSVRPQSLAARQRLEERTVQHASDGDMMMDDFRTKLFSVREEVVVVETGAVVVPFPSLRNGTRDAGDPANSVMDSWWLWVLVLLLPLCCYLSVNRRILLKAVAKMQSTSCEVRATQLGSSASQRDEDGL